MRISDIGALFPSAEIGELVGKNRIESTGKIAGYDYYFRFNSGRCFLGVGGIDPARSAYWFATLPAESLLFKGRLNESAFAEAFVALVKALGANPDVWDDYDRHDFPGEGSHL